LAEIASILDELGHNLKLFTVYRSSVDLDEEILSALFDILVELTLTIASAIRHFRSYRIQDALSPHSNWSTLVSRFSGNLRKLRSRIDQLQKLAEAKNSVRSHAELIQKLEEMQLTSQATTPTELQFQRCQTIPHPPNPAFYGRNDVLQDISAAFERQTSRPASVAVWGTAGIGKTQIALEFAHRLWSSGQETILWIASETTAEVARSFNDAAKGLNLDGYSATNTPDQNRHLVLQWLQRTGECSIQLFFSSSLRLQT
jgi:DNA replication protein DnaC